MLENPPRGARLARTLEPEAMDSDDEACAYDAMDHRDVNRRFVETHLAIGIDALLELRDSGESVKHMRFEERR
jgi:hypothetical protein